MFLHHIWRRPRSAYTLVEMLIVVSIMIMLVAVSLPVAKKVMDGSQGREASRQLNAYFAMAKARALQTGRPCGIFFPFPTSPLGVFDPGAPGGPPALTPAQLQTYWPARQVTQVFLAEVPPPYAGGTTGTLGKIWDPTGAGTGQRAFQAVLANGAPDPLDQGTPPATPTNGLLHSLINPGEVFQVRFAYKGEWYRCLRGISTNTTYPNPNIFYYTGPATTLPPGYNDTTTSNSGGRPFQVLRSPRPIGNPMELPRGTCIDITYSGMGATQRRFPPPTNGLTAIPSSLAVMLSPNGAIDSMYVNGFPTTLPTGSLYFLIGKPEKAPTLTTTAALINPTEFTNFETSNLADPASLWVVVSRSTGQVTTTENLPPSIDTTTLSATNLEIFPGEALPPAGRNATFTGATLPNAIGSYLYHCRTAATLGEQMTGR